MKKELLKKRIVFLGLFFLFAIIAYGITSYSSTLTYSTVCGNLDSYVYRYMGMLMAKGGIPYRDAFDNKGPLLYLLNCIGYKINWKYGVFIIEFVFMMAYLTVQFMIAGRFADVKRSVIYTIASLGPVGAFFVGNMTEEYSLVFISVGILVFIDYFLFDKKDWYRIVICGMACGAVLMIRPNMIAVWAVFCIYAVFVNIREKKTFPFKTMLWFTAGALTVILPFLVWLGANGALEEFWKDYILTNRNYSTVYNSLSNIVKSFKTYFLVSISEIYILLVLFLIFRKENKGFNISYLILLILNPLVISLPGKGFEHYGMVILPTLIYPVSASSVSIKQLLKTKKYLFDTVAFLTGVLCIGFMINNYRTTIPALLSGNPRQERDEKVVSVILENTEPEDRILVLGFKDYYYVESDRLASSKFHLLNSINEDYPGGIKAVIEDINSDPPKLVIVQEGYDDDYFNFDDYILIDDELNIWMVEN